jgi:hypothetical protein
MLSRSREDATDLTIARQKVEKLRGKLPDLPVGEIAKATRLTVETVQAILKGAA